MKVTKLMIGSIGVLSGGDGIGGVSRSTSVAPLSELYVTGVTRAFAAATCTIKDAGG